MVNTTPAAPTIAPGRWEDAYVLRSSKTKVHLTGDDQAAVALCGAPVKPWTRPHPDSKVCDRCSKKAHRPHRDHIAAVDRTNRRRGARPIEGQTDIVDAAQASPTKPTRPRRSTKKEAL